MTRSSASGIREERVDDRASFRFVAAVFLALTAHMAFFLFKEKSPAIPAVAMERRITAMLPSDPVASDQKALARWMEMLDSSYLMRPDRKRGFSMAPQPGMVDDLPLRVGERFSIRGGSGLKRIPLPKPPPGDESRHLWSFIPAPIPASPPCPELDVAYPAWFSERGRPLPQLFRGLPKIRERLAASQKAGGETILAIRFMGKGAYPEVAVERSCGDSELDRMALRALKQRADALPDSEKKPFEKHTVSLKWRRRP